MDERRDKARHRVLKAGTIEFGGGGAIDCTIRNLSDTGAALDVSSPVGIPDHFSLFVQGRRNTSRLHRDLAQGEADRGEVWGEGLAQQIPLSSRRRPGPIPRDLSTMRR
ncbi:hypothetical protein ACVIN2_004640 [Bradyrhizobium sp. USDA 3650]